MRAKSIDFRMNDGYIKTPTGRVPVVVLDMLIKYKGKRKAHCVQKNLSPDQARAIGAILILHAGQAEKLQ